MKHYRWIEYPADMSEELRKRYNALADALIQNATEPIAIVWCNDGAIWCEPGEPLPDSNCLLVLQHVETGYGDTTFGRPLSTHKVY